MRITYVANTFFSPSESFIRDLATGLAKSHEVSVVASTITESGRSVRVSAAYHSPLSTGGLGARLQRHIIRLTRGDADAYHFRQQQRSHKRLREPLLDRLRPDVIFCDYGTNGVLLTDYCTSRKTPLIVHFHGYDLSAALVSPAYRNALGRLADTAAQIIVPSDHMSRLFTIATGAKDRATTIPCGPDISRIAATALNRATRPQEPTLCAVGRLTAKKNPLALVEAFRIVRQTIPNVRLDWIGDGELRDVTLARIAQHELSDAITLYGARPHDEAIRLMARSAVFVQHSCTAPNGDQEGMPVAILEARCLGLPIVSTRHSGIPEAVAGYPSAALVPEHDYVGMAEHIIAFLHSPPPTPTAAACHHYSLDERISRVNNILEAVQASTRAP